MLRRHARHAVLLLVLAHFAWPLSAAAASAGEYEIKAAFIYNFTKFVRWPEPDDARPVILGIIGEDPFGGAIDRAVTGKHVGARRIHVVRVAKPGEAARCDILFVSASEERNLKAILQGLGTAPVLTIGDTDGFAERGGMINLVTEGNRVRFEINLEAMERAGLKASSQLLRLATIVTDR